MQTEKASPASLEAAVAARSDDAVVRWRLMVLLRAGYAWDEAVDDRRRRRAGLGGPAPPLLVVGHRRGPGDVVDGAGALDAPLAWRRVVDVEPAAPLAARLPRHFAARLEREPLLEEPPARLGRARVGAHAVEALER